MKSELPEDWNWVTFSGVAEINPKIPNRDDIPDDLEVQFLPMKLVEELSGKINLTETKTYGEVKKGYTPFINGDVIFAKVTPCMENGKIAIVEKLKNKIGFGSSEFHVVRSKGKLLNKYAFYYLIQQRFRSDAENAMTGAVGLRRVPKQFIENYTFPFPPPNVQQQIVSKIEELFSELDKGIEELKTAQQQLKVYRQAVLKWAFEGKLTNEDVTEGELPRGWQRIELSQACVIKRGKSKHRPRNEPSLFGGRYPFIQTGDIRNANGGYISTYNQTYSEVGLQQSKLWPKGTLCITIAANIGETAILNFDACFPDSVVGLICNEEVLLNKYTNYFFISYKSRLEEIAPATAQKNINVEILEKVKIPICHIEEQQKIVREIESCLSVCDKMRETITDSLIQAEALRQSILKKAFGGKLL